MNQAFRDVLAFHRKFGCATGTTLAVPDDDVVALRCLLIDEEYRELKQAMDRDDLPGIAKEAIDLIYVVTGTLIAYGISAPEIWEAVHSSNMSKDGSKRGDGKVCKGDGYTPPDVAGLLENQAPIPCPGRGEMTAGERAALEELEHRIAQTVRADVIGLGLREIRDRDLYRGTHGTFEDYCAGVWKYNRHVADLFLACAEPESRYSVMAGRMKHRMNLISPAPRGDSDGVAS